MTAINEEDCEGGLAEKDYGDVGKQLDGLDSVVTAMGLCAGKMRLLEAGLDVEDQSEVFWLHQLSP